MSPADAQLEFWSEYDQRLVTIDGLRCRIRVTSYRARYPYERLVVNVHAVPTAAARRSEKYRQRRRELGDDWFTDVLDSGFETQEEILAQLEKE